MEADFSGYATKNGLLCSDGRTILAGAFQHQDKQKVPLVWQHTYDGPGNVLGYATLEHRDDGVYAYGFFNDTDAGRNAKMLVQHGDINSLSIHANKLVHRGRDVTHGMIREVSLVLTGANPGALIDNVSLAHSDGHVSQLDDEAVIYTGIEFSHSDNDSSSTSDPAPDAKPVEGPQPTDTPVQPAPEPLKKENPMGDQIQHADTATAPAPAASGEETVADVFNTLSEKQKQAVYILMGVADEEAGDSASHSDLTHAFGDQEVLIMSRNVFDQTQAGSQAPDQSLSHADVEKIVSDAEKNGSLKDAVLRHAQEYGIENIDVLFPDAKTITSSPEIIGRRTEWVADVLAETKHSPIARIRSTAVDLTADEARAKGYVKGNMKKEEVIKLLKRVTTPTTIYKKQKLDRDDIVDITDLDVVAWLKAEMRLMLDEELAAAILVGDGRDAEDDDKINEDHLRPIAFDADMYAHQLNIASDLDAEGVVEAILRARVHYKGTGTPTLYTTDAVITDLILQKDKMGRRLYDTPEALAAALRVRKIIAVEAMDRAPEVVAIMVNLNDYTLGADKGGNVSLFDDFDIDYNQYKYLIETRVSGALTKPKSAIVIKRPVGVRVTPSQPSFDSATNTITFPDLEGVVYKVNGVEKTGTLVISDTTDVDAYPETGFSFPPNTVDSWVYNPTGG